MYILDTPNIYIYIYIYNLYSILFVYKNAEYEQPLVYISVIGYKHSGSCGNSFKIQAQPPAERWMKHRVEFELWAFHKQEIKADWESSIN